MVGHNPDHDKDEVTQAMVRAMKGKTKDDPFVQSVLSNYDTLQKMVLMDPTIDPENELGRYEYIIARWKSN
jgi:hypothetical protein